MQVQAIMPPSISARKRVKESHQKVSFESLAYSNASAHTYAYLCDTRLHNMSGILCNNCATPHASNFATLALEASHNSCSPFLPSLKI